MRNRLSGKLLAVILTIAICATTVLGCLMTVSAAEPCYKFSASTFAEGDLTQATIDVTFTAPATLPDGFSAGQFSLTEEDVDANDYLVIKNIVAVTEGVTLTESEDEKGFYIFDADAAKSEVIFKITVGFSKGEASRTGKEYKVTLNDVELANSDIAYYTESGNAYGTISAGCKHVIAPAGNAVKIDEINGYSVYSSSVCTLCGETFGYQIVPVGEDVNASTGNVPTIEDTFEGRTELATKYDKNGDPNADANDSANWVLDCEGAPHRTWGFIDADIKLLDETKENSEANPYIIENAEQLFYIVKIGGSKTAGKYYKVADGIRAFHLNPNVNDKTSFEDMMANISKSGANWDSAAPFQGHFDGNGIIITGIRTTTGHAYAGLFPQIKGDVTIKNVTIMNSYIVGSSSVGGFIGRQIYTAADGVVHEIRVENCAIYQCYMESTNATTGIGAIAGHISNSCNPGSGWINGDTIINNCYVNLDEQYFVSKTETSGNGTHGGAVGYMGSSIMNVTNSIFIGIRPYTARNLTGDKISGNNGWQAAKSQCYNNVYTTHPCDDAYNSTGTLQNFSGRVFTLSDAQFKGEGAVDNMSTLDWDSVWCATSGYPTLYKPYNVPAPDTSIIYWDGTVATGIAEGTGAKDDPYIINTVAEFAYAVGQTKANYAITDGKYFKLADGIKTIVLQPKAKAKAIMALKDAAAVKSYFESESGLLTWKYYGWETSTFCGNIDFNGATIYGGYIKDSTNNAALISNIDAGAVISNLALKNCYFTSASGSYQVGAIAAVTNGSSHGKSTNGFIWFNNCTVANNYLYNSSTGTTRSGIFLGASSDIIYVDNCLVYGNDATYGSGDKMSLYSGANNSVLVSSAPAIPDGLTVVDDGADTPRYYNIVRNSIFLGFNPINVAEGFGSRVRDLKGYVNCYTDSNVDTDVDKNGKTALQYFYVTTTAPYITKISASDALGAAAETNMPNLAWGSAWVAGAEGAYPTQMVFAEVGVSKVSSNELSLVGTNLTYNDDGTFDFNIHFVPTTAGNAPVMYLGTTDASLFYKLEAAPSSKQAELGADALMYTIPNISAKDVDKVFLPTLVSKSGATVIWGRSQEISVAKTAKAIANGNYDSADKTVASAVLNYGSWAKEALAITTNNYNAGTVDLLEFGDYLLEIGSTSKWYDNKLADNGETGTAADPIIIDSAEEFVYLSKASGDDTKGKYYKVADGIAGFDLSNGKLDYTKGFAANKTVIKGSGKNHAGGTPGFQGYFDGNGVTVYGAWSNHEQISSYVGLFSCTKGDVTIKNINVRLSSFTAKNAVGGIVGYHTGDGTNTLTIENCSVAESEIVLTGDPAFGSGVAGLVGYSANLSSWKEADKQVDGNGDGDMTDTIYVNGKTIINNCYVNFDPANVISTTKPGVLTDTSKRGTYGGFVGFMTSNGLTVNNSYAIGITPYAVQVYTGGNDVQHSGLPEHFNNVYTNMGEQKVAIGGSLGTRDFTGRVTVLTDAQMTGIAAQANMTALDFNKVWTATSGYPTFINKNYTSNSGVVLSWDGSVATGIAQGSGTKADPYIINTAAELAWLVQQKGDVTLDKYYKVADGVTAIVLQSADKVADIMALNSAAETKAYFESGSHTQWKTTGWEVASFCGNFDGNGAVIYGMYATSTNNAALFCTVDAGATIKNVAIKNAYLTSSASNYQVAAIAAVCSSSGFGAKNKGVFAITGCTVANCYMRNSATGHDRTGVLFGACSEDAIYVENCLVYGNDAYYGANYENKTALVAVVFNNMSPSTAKLPEGITPTTSSDLYNNEVRNSVILGCDVMNVNLGRGWRKNDAGCYTNVYTDMEGLVNGVITYPTDNTTFTYGANTLVKITAADAMGPDAITKLPNLGWAKDGSGFWHVGAAGDMPGAKPAGNMSSAAQAVYDSIKFDTADVIGAGAKYHANGSMSFGVYQTALSLKANPYMSFAFAFLGEYRENRGDIKIRFTYTQNGATVTGEEISVPAAVDANSDGEIDDIVNVNGWTNTAKNGRYHTYKAECIPVEALANGIKVEAKYGDGAWVDFGTYSIDGLGMQFEMSNKATPSEYWNTRVEAAKALLFYTQAINARYGSK